MKSKFFQYYIGATVGTLIFSPLALAIGTASNTPITNTATISYSVSTIAQTPITSAPSTFVVDNKVNVSVTEIGGTLTNTANSDSSTPPTDLSTMLTYTVSNLGNTDQGYTLLAFGNIASGQTLFDKADSFDVTINAIMVDENNDGLPNDTLVGAATTHLPSLSANASQQVFVFATVPAGLADGNVSLVSLTATTTDAGTTNVTTNNNATADNQATVDVVFFDAAGSDDAANDGQHSARDGYLIVAAQLSMTKTVSTIWDPVLFNVNSKSIPGAYARYRITLNNNASATSKADLTSIDDTLALGTVLDPMLLAADCTGIDDAAGPAFTCLLEDASTVATASTPGNSFHVTVNNTTRTTTSFFVTGDATDADGGSYDATSRLITLNLSTILAADAVNGYGAGELKAGETVIIIFNAIIQ